MAIPARIDRTMVARHALGQMSSLFLRPTAAPDPRWSGPFDIARVVETDRHQVALKEPAQVIRTAIQTELDCAPVDGRLHLGGTAEGEGDIRPAWSFFGGHLAEFFPGFTKVSDLAERNVVKPTVGVLNHDHRQTKQRPARIGDRQRKPTVVNTNGLNIRSSRNCSKSSRVISYNYDPVR
jgi:hypothetical protein